MSSNETGISDKMTHLVLHESELLRVSMFLVHPFCSRPSYFTQESRVEGTRSTSSSSGVYPGEVPLSLILPHHGVWVNGPGYSFPYSPPSRCMGPRTQLFSSVFSLTVVCGSTDPIIPSQGQRENPGSSLLHLSGFNKGSQRHPHLPFF